MKPTPRSLAMTPVSMTRSQFGVVLDELIAMCEATPTQRARMRPSANALRVLKELRLGVIALTQAAKEDEETFMARMAEDENDLL